MDNKTGNLKEGGSSIRVAICGFGEIATKAHLPVILGAPDKFRLVAVIDPYIHRSRAPAPLLEEHVSMYKSLTECINDDDNKSHNFSVDAVSICTPPSVTLDLATEALTAGKHVMVEKPPGDWARLAGLQRIAAKHHVTFFTGYHSAACTGMEHAKEWLLHHRTLLTKVHVTWKESVCKWHPGQEWVTRQNNTNKGKNSSAEGVLDMVFNPLSILVALQLGLMQFQSAALAIPDNWQTPVSGTFVLSATIATSMPNKEVDGSDNKLENQVPILGEFAWNYDNSPEGPDEIWTIDFFSSTSENSNITFSLREGGCQAYVNGHRVTTQPTPTYPLETEYKALYKQFASLIANSNATAVDDTTPRLLQEIQDYAIRSRCAAYAIP